MLPSLPRVSQPSTPRTPQQHVTTHKWPPQYRRQPPGTGRQRLSRSLCAGKAARGQFGRPALFGLRFTALHCASDGSRAGATHFFSLPKKVQLGSFLTGLESPPRRCRGSCRRLTTSARGFRACKCHEPRSSVYLVGGGFSWSPQAAAAARNGKQRAMHPPANLCANSPALDLFRTIDSSSHLNSIPTYLATRLGTVEQVRRLLARHDRSSPEKLPHLWVRCTGRRTFPEKGRRDNGRAQ